MSALAIAIAAVLSACGGTSKVEQTPRVVQVGSFVGEYSAATGTLTITPTGVDPIPMGLVYTAALEEIPIEQDGNWGVVSADHVEMRTVSGTFHAYAGGCPGAGLFVADVEIHSGFAGHQLVRPYVEITSVPTGYASCLGVPAPLDSTMTGAGGLFAYPNIAAGGYGTATWSFALPTQTDFRFVGKLWAEKVERTPPVTGNVLAAGTYTAPQTLTLTCTDTGGSGCAGTFYRFGAAGTPHPYTAPIHLSGTQEICYWSEDLRGNAETQTCRTYTVNGAAVTATRDGTLLVPRCSTVAASCSSGTLLEGRGATPGMAESGAPNTLGGTCADSSDTSGTEAVQRLAIQTLDGGPIAPGKTVRVSIDVNVVDNLDVVNLFWASSTTAPAWGSLPLHSWTSLSSGAQTLTHDFALPDGAVAIRGQIAWGDPGSACGNGTWTGSDQDDLVFTPDVPAPAATTASITSPASGADVFRQALLTATAVDPTAVVTMAFQYLTADVGAEWQTIDVDTSPPFAAAWDTETAVYGSNSAQVRVQFTDTAGNTTGSDPVQVTIRNRTQPSLGVTAPAEGAALSRATPFAITTTPTGIRGVLTVDFYVDGAQVAHQTNADAPEGTYSYTFDPSGLATTYPHTIFVRAGDFVDPPNVGQSAIVHFTVN